MAGFGTAYSNFDGVGQVAYANSSMVLVISNNFVNEPPPNQQCGSVLLFTGTSPSTSLVAEYYNASDPWCYTTSGKWCTSYLFLFVVYICIYIYVCKYTFSMVLYSLYLCLYKITNASVIFDYVHHYHVCVFG